MCADPLKEKRRKFYQIYWEIPKLTANSGYLIADIVNKMIDKMGPLFQVIHDGKQFKFYFRKKEIELKISKEMSMLFHSVFIQASCVDRDQLKKVENIVEGCLKEWEYKEDEE